MGNETILYYVTEESITDDTEPVQTGRRHFFRKKTKLQAFTVEEDGLTLVVTAIPCRKTEWKKEILFRQIRKALENYSETVEGAELIIQPRLSRALLEQSRHPFQIQSNAYPEIFWDLSGKLLEKRFETGTRSPESVFLLLGDAFFPEEQMRRLCEMIQPFLRFVNRLTILYEQDAETEDGGGWERLEEAIQDYTDTFYFEYGLVSQIWRGREYPVKAFQSGGLKGTTLCLDCGYQGKIPLRALREGDSYFDIFSSEIKETLFRRKARGICYLSPLKYLDTMVKSGYDK